MGFQMSRMPMQQAAVGVTNMPTMRYQGRIKSFNAEKGFGFIESQQASAAFGRDVFLHKAQIGDLKVGADVAFEVENKSNGPQARNVTSLQGGPAVKSGGSPKCKGK